MSVSGNSSESLPDPSKVIGIIGMGDMGRLYANKMSKAGWRVVGCDVPSKYTELKEEFKDSDITIVQNGHLVSRQADYIIYSVGAEVLESIVSLYGPSTKIGAIVGGQTSCKAPEIEAFEKHLPPDVAIVSCHSMHGPKVDPTGQPLVIIHHRGPNEAAELVRRMLKPLNSTMVNLTATEHDKITADTQAVTHAAFLSMGTAWKSNRQYPWDIGSKYTGGLENAKVNIALRIYSSKWHVYAGLAITNPAAHVQVHQYTSSVTELFKMILASDRQGLRKRLYEAREFVFGAIEPDSHRRILLTDEVLGKFSLSNQQAISPPNSHLSILAIADSWKQLGILPYDHMICSTPLFRIWLGVTEYLFCTPGLLDSAIDAAIDHEEFRQDDLEFTVAARMWSKMIAHGDFTSYRKEFQETQEYFSERLPEAVKLGNEMIAEILRHAKK